MIYVKFPLRLQSEANQRDHWAKRHRRFKSQREIVAVEMLRVFERGKPRPPLSVTLTRIAPRQMDSDNLAGAFKAVRDHLADVIGVDDGSDKVSWHYRQRKGQPKEHAVEIRIEKPEVSDETA